MNQKVAKDTNYSILVGTYISKSKFFMLKLVSFFDM